jgi:hypothetical protein
MRSVRPGTFDIKHGGDAPIGPQSTETGTGANLVGEVADRLDRDLPSQTVRALHGADAEIRVSP